MRIVGVPLAVAASPRKYLGILAACTLLAAFLIACGGNGGATDDRILDLEAKAHSQEEALERLSDENATLREELAAIKQEQVDFVQSHEAARASQEHEEEVADFEEVQEQQLANLEEGQVRAAQRLDEIDTRLQEVEEVAAVAALVLPAVERLLKNADDPLGLLVGPVLERTARLSEEAGGEIYNIDSGEPEERAILVTPPDPIEGNPLIVSLHGYGGDSALHSLYIPFHERIVSHGFGLLLPNGTQNSEGQRFWNPTDFGDEYSKSDEDDFAYLSGLVARAKALKDFGPVYFFGYSNGGFMAHYMACKGLPSLRAVASLAGTSYVDDSSCQDAPSVSVLHIHGTADEVVLFEGDETEPDPKDNGERAFYASAQDMVSRGAQQAGCEWPQIPQAYDTFAFDHYIPGAETHAYRVESGCPQGINIELWTGEGSGHTPAYGDAFVNALLDWLLSQTDP